VNAAFIHSEINIRHWAHYLVKSVVNTLFRKRRQQTVTFS